MKKAETTYIIVGKIGSTYGIKGWLKIHTFTEFDAGILQYDPWYLSNDEISWQPIQREDGRLHQKTVIVKFVGVDNPEQARLLTGKTIAITRTQLPTLEKNEYYWTDLQGLTVIDQHNKVLGIVSYLIETGSNDVLVVKGEKEQAIPYLPGSTVTSIDLDKGEIHVDWEEI